MLKKREQNKVFVLTLICILFITTICYGCGRNNSKSKTDDEKTEEGTINSYQIEFSANTTLDEGEFRILCPNIQFEEENNDLEEK